MEFRITVQVTVSVFEVVGVFTLTLRAIMVSSAGRYRR